MKRAGNAPGELGDTVFWSLLYFTISYPQYYLPRHMTWCNLTLKNHLDYIRKTFEKGGKNILIYILECSGQNLFLSFSEFNYYIIMFYIFIFSLI